MNKKLLLYSTLAITSIANTMVAITFINQTGHEIYLRAIYGGNVSTVTRIAPNNSKTLPYKNQYNRKLQSVGLTESTGAKTGEGGAVLLTFAPNITEMTGSALQENTIFNVVEDGPENYSFQKIAHK